MAEADKVVIDFQVNKEELVSTIDYLVKIGAVGKEVAASYKSTGDAAVAAGSKLAASAKSIKTETDKSVKTVADLAAGVKSLNTALATGASNEAYEQVLLGINDALTEANVSQDEFVQGLQNAGITADNAFDKIAESETKLDNSGKSLKAQLRALKDELSLLEDQGKENTDQFQKTAVAAARLQDQIDDTQTRVKALASDTFAFDATLQGLNALAGGFAAAQGAAALFGDENKELQETLVKLNALIAISTGLQQVQNALQKESAIVQAITLGQQKLSILQTSLDTAATSTNIITKYAAIAAQKALNLVQSLSPAGALALAVGALVIAYNALSDSSDDALESQLALNKAQANSFENLKTLNDIATRPIRERIAAIENEIKLQQSLGASKVAIGKLEVELANQKARLATQSAAFLDVEKSKITELEAQYENAVTVLKSLKEELLKDDGNKTLQLKVEVQESNVANLKAQLEAAENLQEDYNSAVVDGAVKRNELIKEANTDLYDDEKARIQARILLAKAGTSELLQAEIDLINKQKQIDLANATSPSQKALIEIQAAKEVSEKKIEFAQNELAAQKAIDEQRLKQVEEGSEQELQLKKKILKEELDEQLLNDKLSAAARFALILQYQNAVLELENSTAQKVAERRNNIEQSFIATKLAIVKQGSEEELRLRQDAIENQADIEKLAAQNSIKNAEELAAKLKEIDAKTDAEKQKLANDFLSKQIDRNTTLLNNEIELSIKRLELQKASTVNPNEQQAIDDAIYQKRLEQIENVKRANDEKLKAGLINEKEYAIAIQELSLQTADAQIANVQRVEQESIASQERIKQATIQAAQTTIDAIFQISANNRNASLQAELDGIEKLKNAEISNKNLTEAQKQKIQDRYDKQLASAKTEAYKKDQEGKKYQAIINGAVAFTAALPNYVLAALTVVSTAAQVAVINSQPTPKYFMGTEYLQRGKNKPGRDTIPIFANEGERIIKTETNLKYYNVLNTIQREKVSSTYANAVINNKELQKHFYKTGNVAMAPPPLVIYADVPGQHFVKSSTMERMMHYNPKIDTKEFAKDVAKVLKENQTESYWQMVENNNSLKEIAQNLPPKYDNPINSNANRSW